MSKIQGKPFIESVLDSLNDTQKTTLLSYVNGTNKNPQFRSLINSENWITKKVGEDTGDYDKVSHIILETYNKTYTGYLIYNASYCVLIAYALNSQELNVLDINLTNKSYKLIKEPLSILELRFELEEAKEGTDVISDVANAFAEGTLKVGASGIDATGEAAGKALLANGTGGASWGDVEALPEITAGDEGKALVVSSGEATWGDAGFSITNLAPAYNSASSYVAGDLCTYNNILYECNASTTGDFDLTKWSATNIAAAVLGLLNVGV